MNATSLSLIERNSQVTVSENSSAYLSISSETPIYVFEGETIEIQLMILTNRLSDNGMKIYYISPSSINEAEYAITDITYSSGPFYGGTSCPVMATIEGISEGIYVENFEVEVFWGDTFSTATANIHVLVVEVTIIVQSPT